MITVMHDELKPGLQDVAFTIPTPFTPDGTTLDVAGLRSNLEFLQEHGANLYVPCGNTGEYYSLSDEERVKTVEVTTETVGDDNMVVAGAGGHSEHVADLGRRYEVVGADALMVMHPDHTHIHEAGLIEYYREIASAVELPLVIYKRGPEVSRNVLVELAAFDEVIGIKYADTDVAEFSATLREAGSNVIWINGIAERYAPAYGLEGATGFTTGVGNFLPRQTLELFDAVQREDWESARSIRDELVVLEEIRDGTGEDNQLGSANNVPVVKHGMELAGLHGGPTREPLQSLDDGAAELVEEKYAELAADV